MAKRVALVRGNEVRRCMVYRPLLLLLCYVIGAMQVSAGRKAGRAGRHMERAGGGAA